MTDTAARPASLLREAAATLAAAGVPSARHDAEQLLALACSVEPTRLVLIDDIDPAAAARFVALVQRRAARVPLQHLVGGAAFRHLELAVGPGVFVPRPESELVAGAAIEAAAALDAPVVVDLCSGSGAIALAVAQEVPAATVHAVELDPAALGWLRRNAAARAAAGDRPVTVHEGDAATALAELDGAVDVVVSNPPYVAPDELAGCDPEVREHDPVVALVSGSDGLAMVRTVAATGRRLLRPGGLLVVEHSDRQGQSAPQVLRDAGFTDVADHVDLAGRPRFTTGRNS